MVDNIPLLRHWFRYTAKSYASGIAAAGRFCFAPGAAFPVAFQLAVLVARLAGFACLSRRLP